MSGRGNSNPSIPRGSISKLRLPTGWDAIEAPVRARAAELLSRGSVFANLTVSREGVATIARVNEPVLAAVLTTLNALAGKVNAAPPTLDGILALKGVIEVTEAEESEDDRRAAETAVAAGFIAALKGLQQMRQHEGEALGRVLAARLGEIAYVGRARGGGSRPQAGSDQGAARRAGCDAA